VEGCCCRRNALGSSADREPQDGPGFSGVLRMTERLEATAALPHEAHTFPRGGGSWTL